MESRLDRVPIDTDHLSTLSTAYRRRALQEVGLLSEGLMVGYDADLSQKLKAAGYRLLRKKDAKCRHYWKDSLTGYLRQQYKYAYYRFELARRLRKAHDDIASRSMVAQVPLTAVVLLAAFIGTIVSPLTLLLLLVLPAVQIPETASLLRKKKDASLLLLPLLFTVRDICWVWAVISWGIKGVLHRL